MFLGIVSTALIIAGGQVCFILGGILFLICAITDFLDGYLARLWKVESKFGKTFDPVADKILVVGAFIGMMIHQITVIPIAAIMIGRDLMMDVMRILLYKKQIVVAAGYLGKIKTILQMVGITMTLLFANQCTWNLVIPSGNHTEVGIACQTILLVASAFSLSSFIIYIQEIRKRIKNPE